MGVAKANVVAKIGSAVEGIIYEIINYTEQTALRGYEGWPKHYQEETVFILTETGDKECFLFIAQECEPELPVEEHYLNYIRKGKSVFSNDYYVALEQLFASTEKHRCNIASS